MDDDDREARARAREPGEVGRGLESEPSRRFFPQVAHQNLGNVVNRIPFFAYTVQRAYGIRVGADVVLKASREESDVDAVKRGATPARGTRARCNVASTWAFSKRSPRGKRRQNDWEDDRERKEVFQKVPRVSRL